MLLCPAVPATFLFASHCVSETAQTVEDNQEKTNSATHTHTQSKVLSVACLHQAGLVNMSMFRRQVDPHVVCNPGWEVGRGRRKSRIAVLEHSPVLRLADGDR